MKIAVDISPISEASSSAHKVRGVGSYIKMLVANLEKFDRDNEYVFVDNGKFPDDADLIHYPYFDPFFITLPPKFDSKAVVTVHDLTPLVFPNNFPAGIRGKLKWVLQKRRLRKADLVITDSRSSKIDVVRHAGIREDRVEVVYLAADKEFKKLKEGSWEKRIRAKYNLPDKFVLYVGDVTWNKNIPRLIEAVENIDIPLVMVGKVWNSRLQDVVNHPWNNDLKKVLGKIENRSKFIRLGFVSTEDLVHIYNAATMFVMPSIYEGFGLPVLEAMTCGCPVITGGGGSLLEVGEDAVLYVDEKDPFDIRSKIEHLLNYPKERSDLSKKGILQAKKFSVEKMIKNTVDSYNSLRTAE